MRNLNQIICVVLVALCVAAPLALMASGEYGRAAAPEALGYVQLNVVIRDGLPAQSIPAATPVLLIPTISVRRL